MKKLYLLTISYITVASISCSHISNESHFEQPSETVKIIETRYYRPLDNNNEWICGDEIIGVGHNPSIVYLDSFDNVVLNKAADNIRSKKRNIYYSAKDHKLDKIYFEELDEFGMIEYMRDDKGNLLKVKLPEEAYAVDVYNSKFDEFEYDSKGNRIIERGKTITKYIKHIPSEATIHYEIYDANCEYSYEGKQGLIESGIQAFDSHADLISKEVIQYYKYGELTDKTTYVYTYDENKLLGSRLVK